MSLVFDCNADCGQRVWVDTEGWEQLRGSDGIYPRDRVHAWLGERVMSALAAHVKRCPNARPGDDGRPVLRLVVS